MTTAAISRKVPLLDLNAQYLPLRDEMMRAVTRVMDSQRFVLGPEVEGFEKEVAESIGARHALGCASGTDALVLALMALQAKPGDVVVTTPYTFFATAGAITEAGARPVFVDIDPLTYNIDPELLRDTLKKQKRVHSIMPVHLYGAAADMDPICEMAKEYGAAVVEDAAQAIGGEYKGRPLGTIGDVGCFSFYPTKNLGCCGDGGLVTTESAELAKRLAALRVHGRTGTYFHEWVGINSRLDAMQAALLRVKLPHLNTWTDGRIRNAQIYKELLGGSDLPVTLPHAAPYQTRNIFNQFVIRCKDRDRLRGYLQENGIGSEIYYPLSLHMQPCYQDLGYKEGDFPESERAARETLSIPIYSELTREDLEYVASKIRQFYS